MAIGDQAAAAGLAVFSPTQDKRLGYQNDNQRGDELANHMVNGTHPFSKITGQAGTSQIANQAVTSAKLADNSVTTGKYVDASITTAKYANGSVTGVKVASKTLTKDNMADTLTTDSTWTLAGAPLKLRNPNGNSQLQLESNGTKLTSVNGLEVTSGTDIEMSAQGVITFEAGTAHFAVGDNGGADRVYSDTIRVSTTSDPANVVIDASTGNLRRSTSSVRYKTDIEDAPEMPSVLDVQPRTWRDKNQAPDDERRFFGVIAEELDALGLSALVSYVDGQPEAVAYDRIAVALIPLVRDLAARVAELEGKGA